MDDVARLEDEVESSKAQLHLTESPSNTVSVKRSASSANIEDEGISAGKVIKTDSQLTAAVSATSDEVDTTTSLVSSAASATSDVG